MSLVSSRRKKNIALLDEDPADHLIDTTRLEPELRALKDFSERFMVTLGGDWRKLEPQDVSSMLDSGLPPSSGDLRLLAIAIFTGTAQACIHGGYLAPYAACPGAMQVDCRHVTRPYSRLHTIEKLPPETPPTRSGSESKLRITCASCHPLDLGAQMTSSTGSRVAVVRYTSTRDPRNDPPTNLIGTQPPGARYTHCREDQVFIRTSYWQAFERMKCDINTNIGDALDDGGLIYTPGVGILRGPLEEGALWYEDPPRADVMWVAVPARPQLAEQEQYAHERDRNFMIRTVDRVFAYAANNGVDILVLPPLGIGAHGCQHPALDVADIIHKATQRYSPYIHHVCIAHDSPANTQSDGAVSSSRWIESFNAAVQNGRPVVQTAPLVVATPRAKLPNLQVYRQGKDFEQLLEKNRKLAGKKPRTPRRTFL